jgi:TetR/AcrR family transcriptional repressor of nem operon
MTPYRVTYLLVSRIAIGNLEGRYGKLSELEHGGTASKILDTAERLVALRGFNGFSYADVARELDITRAALHYHFASKSDLGEALVNRYSRHFMDALTSVEARTPDTIERLSQFTGLYLDTLQQGRMCLCGMLAAEQETLPLRMQTAIVQFFRDSETWLARILGAGVESHSIEIAGEPAEAARALISTLEGGLLMARLFGDVVTFQAMTSRLVAAMNLSSSSTR